MSSGIASLAASVYGVGLLVFAGFCIQLALRGNKGVRAKLLLAAVAASILWELSGLVFALTPIALAWLVHQLSDAARLSLWLALLATLVPVASGQASRKPFPVRAHLLLAGGAGVVLAVAATSAYVISRPAPATAGSVASLAFGLGVLTSVFGLMRSEQLLRATPVERRWAIKPLCLALAGMFGFDLFLFSDAVMLRHLDPALWAVRGIVPAMMIPLIMLATVRNRHWTIDVGVSRSVVMGSFALLLSGCYLLAVAGAGYYVRLFGGDWGRAMQATLLVAALVLLGILFSSGTIRSRLRVFVSKHFFSYRYDYRQEWLRFTATLAADKGNLSIAERAIKALGDLVESPGGCLWLRVENGTFQLAGRWNFPEIAHPVLADSDPARFLARTGWVVDLCDRQLYPERYPGLEIPEWLAGVKDGWLIIPLTTEDSLIGFALLARARAKVTVNWEVRDVLKTAARQAASFIGHVRAAEALVEARQFDAFNRMSAFVVHDLKNLVTQLSLLVRNAERHASNPDFQRDMLATVKHVVGRMNRLLLQLRSGAAPMEKPAAVDVAGLIQRAIAPHLGQSRAILVSVEPGLRAIGHDQRLERVFGHLIQNAVDATRSDGRIRVDAHREAGFSVIDIEDDGEGMTAEFIRDHLFKPFRSTKPTGMGIGTYESHQYLTELGGRITVDSAADVGTRMRVYLPIPSTEVTDNDQGPQREAA
jgi:putative PEP-CTERM system histidine kinase